MHTLQQLKNGELAGAKSLKLSDGLTEFPREIFELADTLEVLDLSGNHLSELPADFGRLRNLKILFCSDNPFSVLPTVLGDCPALEMVGFKACQVEIIPPASLNPNLRWLILTDNKIEALPAEIGLCSRMEKLMLAGNRLTSLPLEMSQCRNLSLLRVSANRLKVLPAWLLSMPRLAWLAFSGNEFGIGDHGSSLPVINWQQLHIEHVLGQGASGVIYKGFLQGGEVEQEVALKIFKGTVTSDGLPHDEMNTFMAAGEHHGLVRLLGQIGNHPQGKKGLVMDLIPHPFKNLGMPPSLQSCTRDVFKEGTVLSPAQVLKIARTIASVAAQLHSRGIIHGDLYAHNTLIDEEGNTIFGDFGAASFYDTTDKELAHALERIEVSAFGYLLDDLLSLCNHQDLDVIERLRDAATAPHVRSRPDFQDLTYELGTMQF